MEDAKQAIQTMAKLELSLQDTSGLMVPLKKTTGSL